MGTENREFEEFVAVDVERLRRVLVSQYGLDIGSEAVDAAVAWAWERWPRIGGMNNPAGYLYRVAQTHAKRALSRGRPIVLPVAVNDSNDAAASLPDVELIDALRELPVTQRMVVLLVHAYGWTPSDVAHLTGMRAVTVRSNLYRALQTLRLNLPQGDPQ